MESVAKLCFGWPARRAWTPPINAAGLGMLPMDSVGSITVVRGPGWPRAQTGRARCSRFIADSHAQGRPHGIEQGVAAERLSEERERAGLEGSPTRLFIAVRGQNDN